MDADTSLADVVGAWRPQATFEPRWSADRAGEYLARWHRAAEAVTASEEAQQR
jgi:hypothetical protein